MIDEAQALPWTTPPSGLGSTTCAWCHRDIYQPALPCSVQPVEGLLRMPTQVGQGERCKFELSTRQPVCGGGARPITT